MTKRLLFLLLLAAVSLSACGSDNKVGEGVDLNIKDQVNNQRLGAATTTTTAASTATSAPQSAAVGRSTTTSTTAAPATTAAPVTTTTAKEAPTLEIAINGDSGGQSQFDPSQARVYAGTLVKWTNKDSAPRSVEADDGTFTSPSIAPGETYTFKADKAGRFNYHDGTRPYAVAALEVLAR
jgi:plastocyanin